LSESKNYSNFAIAFNMQTPIMLGHPWLALDGILAHLINRELRGQDYYTLPSKEVIPQTFLYHGATMPLAQTKDIFHASVAWLDCNEASTATIYKRFAEQQCNTIKTKKKAIDIARGHFKAYRMVLPYLSASKAIFYVRGNLKEIVRLLSYLPGLGKKVAYGYGAYRSISVEETPENWSLIKDNIAMRPIPLNMLEQASEQMYLAYRPPYWDKTLVKPCAPPGSIIKFKKEYKVT